MPFVDAKAKCLYACIYVGMYVEANDAFVAMKLSNLKLNCKYKVIVSYKFELLFVNV